MSKVIAAFLGAEVRQTGAEERPKGLGGSTAGGTHEGFELREAELNGIEVWTVGRQIPERGADALDRAADARDFVGGEIVGDHDVPGSQRGHEDLFDIGKETRPVDGASKTPGAVRPVTRSAASNVLVCHRAHGAWSWTRAPRRARPYRRRRLFVMPVSSRKTRRVGSQVGAAACHTTRAAATSGRSCSEGRTVFFDGHVQGRHRAPDRRQTGRRAERVLQLGQGAIRLLRDQRGQSVQVRLQHPAPPVPLDARCDFARLPPALLQQPHPRPAHAVLHRDVRGLHPGITVEQGSFSEIRG